MILNGALINFIGIILGSLIGLLLKNKFPKKIIDAIMTGMGLCVLYIGISGSLKGQQIIVIVFSVAIGSIIGELIDIDTKLQKFGDFIGRKFSRNGELNFSEGFVSSTLLFCVGAMAIVGSLQSSIGNHTILYTKSIIDAFVSITMASMLGAGVIFSAFSVLFYEGALTLFSNLITQYLPQNVINEMTCVGSLLIIAIGLNMLKITKIKVANLCLAPFIPMFIYLIIKW